MLWEDNYLMHYGIKGQKWGVRRFQNPDGTLTAEGKQRYGETDTGTGGERELGPSSDVLEYVGTKKLADAYRSEIKVPPQVRKVIRADIDDVSFNLDHSYEEKVAFQQKQINDLKSLPKGKVRDDALTEYLRLHSNQGDYDGLVELMIEKSGDLMNYNSPKSKANKEATDAYLQAASKETDIMAKLSDQAKKEHKLNYDKRMKRQKELWQNSDELHEAISASQKSFQRYCETVLRDMGMPVNDKTLEYIKGIIYWN